MTSEFCIINLVDSQRQSSSWLIRAASPGDLTAIIQLLQQRNLPTEGIAEHLVNFLVGEVKGRIIGTVGLELYGTKGVVRSLAVVSQFQGRGYGQKLLWAILGQAKRLGLTRVYLLTETAETFFARFGFSRINRDKVDPLVAASPEFTNLCPLTATCMTLSLIDFCPEGE
jgi:amino-acid N-acetyltransferase